MWSCDRGKCVACKSIIGTNQKLMSCTIEKLIFELIVLTSEPKNPKTLMKKNTIVFQTWGKYYK